MGITLLRKQLTTLWIWIILFINREIGLVVQKWEHRIELINLDIQRVFRRDLGQSKKRESKRPIIDRV
jgi:hypothetical protein